MDMIAEFLLLFIPRFRTDTFAIIVDDEGDWEIYCMEKFLTDEDIGEYTAIGLINYFTWLGMGFNLKLLDVWEE